MAILGIASANPEADLLAFDARIVGCTEERLRIESHAVTVGDGRFVFVFRVPSSIRKPHCVRFQGHVYFPSRRERNRYEMDVREIKEQTMNAASQLQRAEDVLSREMAEQVAVGWPSLFAIQLPVFLRDFLVDITREDIKAAMRLFDVSGNQFPDYRVPIYTFAGLQRADPRSEVTLHRNGMLTLKTQIPGEQFPAVSNQWRFQIAAFDLMVHEFAVRAKELYLTAELDSPAILGVEILTSMDLLASWNRDRAEKRVPVNEKRRLCCHPSKYLILWRTSIESFALFVTTSTRCLGVSDHFVSMMQTVGGTIRGHKRAKSSAFHSANHLISEPHNSR